jgi:hypothetical protein
MSPACKFSRVREGLLQRKDTEHGSTNQYRDSSDKWDGVYVRGAWKWDNVRPQTGNPRKGELPWSTANSLSNTYKVANDCEVVAQVLILEASKAGSHIAL